MRMSRRPRPLIVGMPNFEGGRTGPKSGVALGAEQMSRLVALYKAGRHTEAIQVGGKLAKAAPGAFQVWNILGASYAQTQQFPKAVSAFGRAAKLRPDLPDPFNNLGNALKGMGRRDAASRAYGRALKIAPDNALALNNLGVYLYDRGELDAAETHLRKALQAAPNYVEAHVNLGNVFLKRGKLDEAKASYQSAAKIQPRYADSYYNLGVIAQQQEDRKSAEAHYLRAVKLQPKHVDAYRNLGVVLKDLEELDKSREATERALEFAPKHIETLVNLGLVLTDLEEWREAIVAYDRALRVDPNYLPAMLGKADALQELGHVRSAVSLLQEASALHPNSVEAKANLGFTLQREGKPEEALKIYAKAMATHSDEGRLHLNLGLALAALGHHDQSIAEMLAGLAVEPDNDVVAWNLARLPKDAISVETIKQLREFYNRSAERISPASKRAFFAADLCRHEGDLDAAFTHLVKANGLKREVIQKNLFKAENTLGEVAQSLADWRPVPVKRTKETIIPIFIFGVSRSGKSLLEGLLAKDSAVAPQYEAIRKLPADEGELAIAQVFYVDPGILTQAGQHALTSTNPFSLLRVQRLADGFADAVFVFVRRDEIDVGAEMFATCYKKGNEYAYDPVAAMRYIKAYNGIADQFEEKLGERAMVVRYDDLLDDPSDVIRRISDHSGAPLAPGSNSAVPETVARHSIYRYHFNALLEKAGWDF